MSVTRAHAVSHVGLVRSSNQDSGYAGTRLFLVADGDDWPKELYGKLGFDTVGRLTKFFLTG